MIAAQEMPREHFFLVGGHRHRDESLPKQFREDGLLGNQSTIAGVEEHSMGITRLAIDLQKAGLLFLRYIRPELLQGVESHFAEIGQRNAGNNQLGAAVFRRIVRVGEPR